jgi:hypothetical protein
LRAPSRSPRTATQLRPHTTSRATWDSGISLVGAAWTLYQYIVTRRIEVRQPFLNKQLELYFKAASVVGNFAKIKPNTEEWKKNESDFWELYWSELSIVESNQVEKAMINVGEALKSYKADPINDKKKEELNDRIYELAHAIRDSIKQGWRGL